MTTPGVGDNTYAGATWTQSLPDWIGFHIRMFQYIGGVPEVLLPDNIMSVDDKTCPYEPFVNPPIRTWLQIKNASSFMSCLP